MDVVEADISPSPFVIEGSGAHPNVLRALKLMRDIHWDTSGAPPAISSVTEYVPMRVRDIREIKREARAEMNKSSRGVQGYPIAPLDLTSRYIRPHSSTAHLISQICSEEKLKASRLAHKLRSKSLNADTLKGSKSIPGRKNPAAPKGSEEDLPDRSPTVIRVAPAESHTDDDILQRGHSSGGGSRPNSRGGNRPQSGGLQRSAFRSDQSDSSIRKKSPNALTKMATFSMGTDTKDGKDRSRPELLPKSKSSVESRQQQILQLEEDAARKIEEKRLRVKERQLALENRERQILWMQMIVHLSRSAALVDAVSRNRHKDGAVKMMQLSHHIVIKILRWFKPVRMKVWCRNNPKQREVLANFVLQGRLNHQVKKRRRSKIVILSFLRDLVSFGDRFKKVKTFRANIIRVQKYLREYLSVQHARLYILKKALDKLVTHRFAKYKRDKVRHEMSSIRQMRVSREFGPSVMKIEKNTMAMVQMITQAAAVVNKGRRKFGQATVDSGTNHHQVSSDTGDLGNHGSVAWYPGSSNPVKVTNPKYTAAAIIEDLRMILRRQRLRHCLHMQEMEKARVKKSEMEFNNVSRIKSFLRTEGDLGPVTEDSAWVQKT